MLTSPDIQRLGTFEIPTPITSLETFHAWAESDSFPETGKVTYVDGRLIFDMSPERTDLHTSLKTEIIRVLGNLTREQDLGHFYSDGLRVINKTAGVSNEPDAAFASWATLESGRFAPPEDQGDRFIELIGTPDWVCEVVSDSSEEKDTKILRDAYFKAGIPEYWLIDARGEAIDFKLLVAGEQGYSEAPVDADGWRQSPVFGCEFHLSRERDRLERWRYTLAKR
ncbi:MAG: Uma2 family endonuclease [Planctomycetota bacterium]